MNRILSSTPWLLFGALLVTPAFADEGQPPHGTEPAAAGEHGAAVGEHGAAAGEHGAAAGEHAAAEGEHGGAHHLDYTGDADHDGTPNWIDGDSGDSYVATKLAFHAINLLLLVGLLVWFVRAPLKDALNGRAYTIRKSLTDTARERDEAAHKFADLEARLGSFEQELERMRAAALTEARAEEERLVARAHEEAKRIGENAERNIRDEVTRARVALQHDAVDLAVQLAETTLRTSVNSDDQKRLARDFLASLSEVGRG